MRQRFDENESRCESQRKNPFSQEDTWSSFQKNREYTKRKESPKRRKIQK